MNNRQQCIDAAQLSAMIDDDTVIIDCRFALDDPAAGARAYAAGHIPGAVYGDIEVDFSSPVIRGITGRHPLPDAAVLARRFASWGIGPHSTVIFYDAISGPFATRAWWCAYWLGLRNIAVLDGGIRAWQSAGYPLRTDTPSLHDDTPRFRYQANSDLIVDSAFVQQHQQDIVLLDARTVERFHGVQEPIDPVAGHIPGAQCLPFQTLINADSGQFLPSAQLRAILQPALMGKPIEATVCYCGSGITATMLVFAFVHAGIGMPRLYPGSWSEWICDRTHQVATI